MESDCESDELRILNAEKLMSQDIQIKSYPDTKTIAIRHGSLAWLTLILGYAGFTAVMVGQNFYNLWLISLLTGGVLLPLTFFSYGPKLDQLLKVKPNIVSFGLLSGTLLALISHGLFGLLVEPWPVFAQALQQCYQNLNVWPGKFWALPIIFLLVLVEEMIWRGLLFDMLQEKLSGLTLVGVATLLFPIPHVLTGNLVLGLAAFGLGLVCNGLRYRFDNLVAPVIAHFSWNLWVMIFFPIQI